MNITNFKITSVDTETSYYDRKKKKMVDFKQPKITRTVLCHKKNTYDGFELVRDLHYFKTIADHQGVEVEVTFNIAEDIY
tara:strand:- start:3079 stop:3318 length:240 start_codon:yes stop_codon:yes gene_type:complete